jgi:hypothetical protein
VDKLIEEGQAEIYKPNSNYMEIIVDMGNMEVEEIINIFLVLTIILVVIIMEILNTIAIYTTIPITIIIII